MPQETSEMTTEEVVMALRHKGVRFWLEGEYLKYDAPAGVVSAKLLAELRARRNDIIAFLSASFQGPQLKLGSSPSEPVSTAGSSLSFAQEGLWFLDQVTPHSGLFNLAIAVEIQGALRVDIVERALSQLVHRHESLRTVFRVESDKPVQVVRPPGVFHLSVHNLTELTGDHPTPQDVRNVVARETAEPFDLENGPLFRASLFRIQKTVHLLIITMHHIVSDGWSLGILQRELGLLYESICVGKPSALPRLPVQYRDFVTWQRGRAQDEGFSRQLRYWFNQLQGLEPLAFLPSGAKPAMPSYHAIKHEFSVPATLAKALDTFGREHGATLFMTLLSSFVALLARHTGQRDIALAVPTANRNRVEFEGLIGFFVNTLIIRIRAGDNPSFIDLLQNVRAIALEAYTHQDVSFERLVAELCPTRDLGRNPLVQVMFALQNAPTEALALKGLTTTPVSIPHAFSAFDLELHVWPQADGLRGVFVYRSELFEKKMVARMVAQLRRVLKAVAARPDILLSELPILSQKERRTLLAEYGAGPPKAGADKCIHSLFEEQARRFPAMPAVTFGHQTLTFGELDAYSNKVARLLRQKGVTTETAVAICVSPSLEMIIGLIGILKAGGAYVPLDPKWPAARLHFVLKDTKATIALTQQRFVELLSSAGLNDVFCLEPACVDIAAQSPAPIPNQALPQNLAYIIYTSGSSGVPRGVMIEHRAVTNLLTAIYDLFYREHRGGANTTLLASFAFDSSVEEIFASLIFGHCLNIVPDEVKNDGAELVRFLVDHEIDICCCAPAHLTLLAEATAGIKRGFKLTHLHVGGEGLGIQVVKNLFDNWTFERRPTLINSYGPTECCVEATSYVVEPARRDVSATTVPIGKPLSNIRVYVVDSFGDLAPIGVPGELCIGGAGLARGYVNSPQLTAEKFVQSRFAPYERIYRTGDVVRWLPSRNLEFLGRTDDQVKIRGFRIEPAEIDCLLAEHPTVLQSVTVIRETQRGEKQLVAYVVFRPGLGTECENPTTQLRDYLQGRLPAYMVPTMFVFLDKIPLTTNGKIDRKALPEPQLIRNGQADSSDRPVTATEQALIKIWSSVFNLEVNISDNFFDLGGHSLMAARLVSMIRSKFSVDLGLREFFSAQSLSELGSLIDHKGTTVVSEANTGGAAVSPVRETETYMSGIKPIH